MDLKNNIANTKILGGNAAGSPAPTSSAHSKHGNATLSYSSGQYFLHVDEDGNGRVTDRNDITMSFDESTGRVTITRGQQRITMNNPGLDFAHASPEELGGVARNIVANVLDAPAKAASR